MLSGHKAPVAFAEKKAQNQPNDKIAHCIAGCEVAKCGKMLEYPAAIYKEAIDIICRVRGGNCGVQMRDIINTIKGAQYSQGDCATECYCADQGGQLND